MKGFIEVKTTKNDAVLINLSRVTDIARFGDKVLISFAKGQYYGVKQTYEEIKQLIIDAQ